MLVAERVNDFITAQKPAPICDRCIMKAMGFKFAGSLAQITNALGTTSDFLRSAGTCSICGEERVVISSLEGPNIRPS